MLRIVDCLAVDHDYGLVLLAALLCLLGCASTVVVTGRAVAGQRPVLWTTLLGVCFSATAWSTHFIAMLAYRTALPITYDPTLTVLSFIVGLVPIGSGFLIALRFRDNSAARLLGGALVGSGVIALHYIGMAGLRFQGSLTYDLDLLFASVVAGVVFGAMALAVLFGSRRAYSRLLGGCLLLIMVVSLHFTGMGAIQLELGLQATSVHAGISRSILAILVVIVSMSVLLIGTAAALIDQQVSARLAAEANRYRTLADGAFEGLLIHRDFNLVDANVAARTLLGLPEDVNGISISHWSLEGRPTDAPGGEILGEVEIPGVDGRCFPAEICRRAISLRDGSEGELIAVRDLTARRESEGRIAYLALHDPLTDLPNRRFFTELSANVLKQVHRDGSAFALLAVDLDNFKFVNDLHGHEAGDELICEVARRLQATLGEGDVVARLGGDEFAVLETSADQPAKAMELARRLQEVMQEPVCLQGVELPVSASVGIAIYPADGLTIEDLLRNADTAMYQSKADGKGTFRFFEEHMNEVLEGRRRLEGRLRQALANGSLSVHYQPLVSSAERAPQCFEALLRWNDEELGSISPGEFIPVAESTGLIVSIGEFVLRQACQDAMGWPAHLRVAVNLSVAQFGRDGLVDTVREALESSGLPGERLEIEITESLLIDNPENALRLLREIQALGVKIAMDDFGTGYSSLSYLQSFNFDKIKIDRTFVANLESSHEDASIVEAVVSMGKSLKMQVVAEGVETIGQADLLANLACDELQGFLIARPMPAAEVDGFLQRHATRRDKPSRGEPPFLRIA